MTAPFPAVISHSSLTQFRVCCSVGVPALKCGCMKSAAMGMHEEGIAVWSSQLILPP